MYLNKVIVLGNVVADPEVKQVGETTVARMRIVTSREYVSKNEKKTEKTGVSVEAWGKNAEIIQKYVMKGKEVICSGRLKEDRWEKDGEKRSKLVVVLDDGPSGIQLGRSPKQSSNETGEQAPSEGQEGSTDDSDAPF